MVASPEMPGTGPGDGVAAVAGVGNEAGVLGPVAGVGNTGAAMPGALPVQGARRRACLAFSWPPSSTRWVGGWVHGCMDRRKCLSLFLTLPSTTQGIMDNLGLSYPKKIDVAVPANMACGLQD